MPNRRNARILLPQSGRMAQQAHQRDAMLFGQLRIPHRRKRGYWAQHHGMSAPGEDAAINRDSLPLASRAVRMVERV
jgi:hypothetical protein